MTSPGSAPKRGTSLPDLRPRSSISSLPCATTRPERSARSGPVQPMTAHWGVPDPAKATGTKAERAFAFDDCFRMLNQRIGIFVSLPLDSLSKLSLQKELDAIGRTRRKAPSEEPA